MVLCMTIQIWQWKYILHYVNIQDHYFVYSKCATCTCVQNYLSATQVPVSVQHVYKISVHTRTEGEIAQPNGS